MHRFFLIVAIGLLFIRCQKDEELNTIEYYNFKTDVVVDYTADTISVGDTLWFHSEVGKFLTDSATNDAIHFKQASINLNMCVRSWGVENQSNQPDKYSFIFNCFTRYVSYIDKATMFGIYYYSSEGKYLMKIGVVFNKAGIYSIDSDYLKFRNYHTNTDEYFGDGIVEFYDMSGNYGAGYLKPEMVAENHNMHLYNQFTDTEKSSFQAVNANNQSKYFFIKVNEFSNE